MLVQDWWRWSGSINTLIRFKQDGTGELLWGVELSILLAAKFDWKPLSDQDSSTLDQPLPDDHGEGIPLVHIQMTLNEDLPPCIGSQPTEQLACKPDSTLAKAAFYPKNYTIQLGRGEFPVIDEVSTGLCMWFLRHLYMDPSPYPPLEEWIVKRPADRLAPWKKTDFHRDTVDGDEYYDPETGTTDVARREQREQLVARLRKQREERKKEAADRES
jgi:hypothetical protein